MCMYLFQFVDILSSSTLAKDKTFFTQEKKYSTYILGDMEILL